MAMVRYTEITSAGGALVAPLVLCAVAAAVAGAVGLLPESRRPGSRALGWLLALGPAAGFVLIARMMGGLDANHALTDQVEWMPTLGLSASLYLDSFSALFGLLVTGIGALVVVYTGYYFSGDRGAWRFFCYILLFMLSMLGLVLAGDVVTLFVFWEATSITSFLLIGYKYEDPAARAGAYKSLLITGGGGIALLAGLLVMSFVAGGTDFGTILSSGDVLRGSGWYGLMLVLVCLGGFTKSAQAPFHIWLPDAMTAPTPASAYLHSATMVKAGVYLLARFHPALGGTDAWFWVLGIAGCVTMVLGAYLGLRQTDLKGLLAYSTVSQLGVLVMLIGNDTDLAYKALIISIVAHALYKGSLFLVVGIVDHEAGTRDLRRLGGLWRLMPLTGAVALVATLSMAGLPPMFGFLAKETLLKTVVAGETAVVVFVVLAVLAGAMIVGQAAILAVDTFLGRQRDESLHPHAPPMGMLLAPAVPAVLGLLIGIAGERAGVGPVLGDAAARVFGAEVPVTLALWQGLNLPLALSALAVIGGVALFQLRHRLRRNGERDVLILGFNRLYEVFLQGVDLLSWLATRTQHGWLRWYLGIMLFSAGVLFYWMGRMPRPEAVFELGVVNVDTVLRAFALAMAVAAAAVAVILRQDFLAILALGGSGLAVALLFALEPAPDVALVMIVVDILTIVLLMLALTRLPRRERDQAWQLTFRQRPAGIARDVVLSVGGAVLMTAVCLTALQTRPRASMVTPFYERFAYELTGSYDIVGAILIDFRAIDTLIEIAVFAMAGAGVYTLVRFASRKAGDQDPHERRMNELLPWHLFGGVGGLRVSPLLRGGAHLLLPIAMLLAAVHVIYGHYRPGDGFTAGVILGLAVALRYVVLGYRHTKHWLWWLRPAALIGAGLVLVLLGGVAGYLSAGHLFAPVNFLELVGVESTGGVTLSTALLFDLSICLVVLGGATFIIETLGRPRATDLEAGTKLRELADLERLGKASPYEGMAVARGRQGADDALKAAEESDG
jgi:multicomponent K+:H+ antiporter subunit A